MVGSSAAFFGEVIPLDELRVMCKCYFLMTVLNGDGEWGVYVFVAQRMWQDDE